MLKAVSRANIIILLLFAFFNDAATAQVAPGVQQPAAKAASIGGTVTQSDGKPVAGADIRLQGPVLLSTTSDMHGAFRFTSVPFGTYLIVVNAAGLGQVERPNITVSADITVVIEYAATSSAGGPKTLGVVTIHAAGAHINVTPASIASVNPSDYAFQGNTSWKELLDHVPGVTVGGNLFGGQTPSTTIPDGPFQPIVLSINGALPYETSTTLDGMPLVNSTLNSAPGGGLDLGFLPMPAFDNADIVRGPGANAPSIVDSVGGSFVLHPPGIVEKNSFEFSASNDPYGGIATNTRATLRMGRLSAQIVYGVNDSPGPLGSQNVFPAIPLTPLTVNGTPFGTGGSVGFIPNATYPNCCGNQTTLLYCCVPFSTAWSQHNGAVGLAYRASPSITAQVFYAGSSSRMEQPPPLFPVSFTPDSGYHGSVAPGMRSLINVGASSNQAQASYLLEEKITAFLGRGVLWLSGVQNNSYDVFNLDPTPNGQYSLYGTGSYASAPSTPVEFSGPVNLTFTPVSFHFHYWSNNRDLAASYVTEVGSASSVGLSYVTSYYNYPDEIAFSIGTPANFNFASTLSNSVAERTNELRVHAGTKLSEKVSLEASWYFARGNFHVPNPSDPTGNTYRDATFPYSAPRLGAVWRPSTGVAIRTALGGGFALPQINLMIGSNGVPSCANGVCSVTLQNLNLLPEKSFGFDAGTDIRLHHDTTLSLDVYFTNLYGQFFTSTNLTGKFNGQPLYTSQQGNLSQSRYDGINLEINHDVPQGMYWGTALGLTRGYVVSVPAHFYDPPQPGGQPQNRYVVPGPNFNGQFQSAVPYANGSAQVGYRWMPGKYVELAPTYYGNNNNYFHPAFVVLDAHAAYSLTQNVSLIASFRNITGAYAQNYAYFYPTIGAPTVSGPPFPLYGSPYGPRTVILTADFKS